MDQVKQEELNLYVSAAEIAKDMYQLQVIAGDLNAAHHKTLGHRVFKLRYYDEIQSFDIKANRKMPPKPQKRG